MDKKQFVVYIDSGFIVNANSEEEAIELAKIEVIQNIQSMLKTDTIEFCIEEIEED